jgi:hypothetical protein
MLGFEVIHNPVKPIWVPVDGTSTLAHGMLLYYGKETPANTGGAVVMPAAAGACDVTNMLIPWGVVIGDNNATPTYSTLATALVKTQTITGVDTAAGQLARDYRLAEGMYGKGDPQPLVQVARITPETVLRGYFRNSATVGTTCITTLSPSAVATTAMTFATFGFTGVVDNSTTYCVSGTNAGLYRVGTDSSATACTYTREWPNKPATTDTFKRVNVRQGLCRMNVDTTYGLWIDNTAALTSNYYVVNVLNLDLSGDSGTEHCDFQFTIPTFLPYTGGRQTDAVT